MQQVLSAKTEDELVEIRTSEEYLAVSAGVLGLLKVSLIQCSNGLCVYNLGLIPIDFILLQMSMRDYIVQQIMVNEVIYTRKASVDQFIDGLCALRFLELLINFPLAFEPLFLASKANTPGVDDVLSLLQLSPDCSSDRDQQTFSMLKDL